MSTAQEALQEARKAHRSIQGKYKRGTATKRQLASSLMGMRAAYHNVARCYFIPTAYSRLCEQRGDAHWEMGIALHAELGQPFYTIADAYLYLCGLHGSARPPWDLGMLRDWLNARGNTCPYEREDIDLAYDASLL